MTPVHNTQGTTTNAAMLTQLRSTHSSNFDFEIPKYYHLFELERSLQVPVWIVVINNYDDSYAILSIHRRQTVLGVRDEIMPI